MKNLTKRQEEILNLIKSHIQDLGFPPTRADIASKLKVKSDILDDSIRTIEVQNWINHLVLPSISN